MKSIFVIALYIIFSVFVVEMNYSNDKSARLSEISSCPSDLERAREDLKNYLANENAIKDLRKKYDLHIDHTAKNKIYVLQTELDQDKCKKLVENSPWLENASKYAFYKADGSYFIVTYSQTEKGNFERQGISIFNEQFERVAIVIDIDTSNSDNR